MEQEKQEQKQEVKKVEVIQPKLCPFISGFLLEPARTIMKEMTVAKTTNVSPCMETKCKFYNENKKDCYILLKCKGE